MVLPASHGIPRVPRYSGTVSRKSEPFRLRDYHPLRWPFPGTFSYGLDLSLPGVNPRNCPTTPTVLLPTVWALPRSLTATEGISVLISLPRGTEMFHFPPFASTRLCIQRGMTPNYRCRVAPFGYPRINACLTAPRGFSQLATSFIAYSRQGIHHAPLVA